MSRPFDLIIFGATGFTGKYAVRSMVQMLLDQTEHGIKFAIAGRSLDKLRNVLQELQPEFAGQFDFVNQVSIRQADVGDYFSLRQMTSQCRVLVNMVGPYALFGESVVKAAIETGTHYVDVSGTHCTMYTFIKRGKLKSQVPNM